MDQVQNRHSPPPTVSIAVPVYNGERYIRGALEMLARQTWRDYELIIVDNGSRDATAQICRSFAEHDSRIRYLRFEETIPPVDNYRRAFANARGRYFLWNAADDRRPPEAIERAVAALDANPGAAMVHGPVELELFDDGRHIVVDNDVGADTASAAQRVAAFTANLRHNGILYGLYRREALQRAVFRQHVGQDFLVCLQVALIGPMVYVTAPLICYLHANGPIDDPMCIRPALTARSLLAWPRQRFKCHVVLVRGCHYLLRESGTPVVTRLRATVAFAGVFVRRYRRHLAAELVCALAAPVAVVLWPVTELARRVYRQRTGAAPVGGR